MQVTGGFPSTEVEDLPATPATLVEHCEDLLCRRQAARLAYLPKAHRRLELEAERLVAELRAGGWTWARIGATAGVSPQAAHRRWGTA